MFVHRKSEKIPFPQPFHHAYPSANNAPRLRRIVTLLFLYINAYANKLSDGISNKQIPSSLPVPLVSNAEDADSGSGSRAHFRSQLESSTNTKYTL